MAGRGLGPSSGQLNPSLAWGSPKISSWRRRPTPRSFVGTLFSSTGRRRVPTTTFEVERLCQLVKGSRSSYHAWVAGAPGRAPHAQADHVLALRIRSVHAADGAPRVTAEFNDGAPAAARVNHKRVARAMREHHLAGVRLRKRVRTTIPEPSNQVVPVLLMREVSLASDLAEQPEREAESGDPPAHRCRGDLPRPHEHHATCRRRAGRAAQRVGRRPPRPRTGRPGPIAADRSARRPGGDHAPGPALSAQPSEITRQPSHTTPRDLTEPSGRRHQPWTDRTAKGRAPRPVAALGCSGSD